MIRTLAVLVALSSVASVATVYSQSVYLRVEISAPNNGNAPVADLKPFNPPGMSLADRTAIQHMWEGMEFQLTPVARWCEMPVEVSIDVSSFQGQLVRGTQDGLHPGTRSRFYDVARAMSAVCNGGDMQRDAVRSTIRGMRFGFTQSPNDTLTIQDGTLVFTTNGDLTGRSHLGYADMINRIMEML